MNSQGFLGPIAQNETLFYALDTIPLFIAIFNVVANVLALTIHPSSTELERRRNIRSQGQNKAWSSELSHKAHNQRTGPNTTDVKNFP